MRDAAEFFDEERLKWRERELQKAILDMAVGTKKRPAPNPWLVYHTYFSDRSEAGFPDLMMVRDRIVYAELKTMRGALSVRQKVWIEAIRNAGGEVYVWRPCCWNSGEIQRVLT